MKKIIFFITSVLIVSTLSQCTIAKGDYITTELKFDEFDAIEVSLDANLYITQGPEQGIIVKGFENQIEDFKNQIDANTLMLNTKDGFTVSFDDKELEFYITIPVLSSLSIKSSSTAIINSFDQSEGLNLDISGSGDIEMNQFHNLTNLNVDISGSGEIDVLNTMDSLVNLSIDISGSGNYNGFLISSNNANVNISGSGEVSLTVQENLNANISGSGEVKYKGFPIINANISGSGEIINAN